MKKRVLSVVLAVCVLMTCFVIANYTVSANTTSSVAAGDIPDTYSAVSANPYSITDSNDNATVLQAWNWSYANLEKEIPKVAAQGFSVVQISPPNEIKEGTKNHKVFEGDSASNGWWMFYQPAGFQINESTDNALGTKAELVKMVKTAHAYGVRVIADSVVNHMGTCDNEDKVTSSDPMAHVTPRAKEFEPEIYNGKLFHSPWFNMTYQYEWNGPEATCTNDLTRGCTSRLPDLKTEDPVVQQVIYEYLQELVDCGIDGFRFDAAKHIETPNDLPAYRSDFWKNTVTKVKNYAKTTYKKDLLSYGEILNTCGYNRKYSAYFPYMKVTDSGVFWDISNAIDAKNASSALPSNMKNGTKAQTVLWDESHDTYMDGNTVAFSTEKRNKLWALIAARDGITSMYFARPATSTSKASFKNDLKKVNMGAAVETDWAKSKAVAGVNKFNNLYAGQGEYLSNGSGVAVIGRGSKAKNGGATLINMQGTTKSISNITVNTMADGTYKDIVGGGTFTVKSGKVSGPIGSTGIAVIYPESMEPTEATTAPPTTTASTETTATETAVITTESTEATTVTDEPTEPPTKWAHQLGDVDLDGRMSVKDATLIQKSLAKLAELNEEQTALADVNQDGSVNVKDATAIQYQLAGYDYF